jgi:3-hydroxyacyl-[acyl-carrier-protein] dehydratase
VNAGMDALRHLPHGPEFRFITRVTELQPGKSGTAEYEIRGDEPFLAGHFPGEPIFPGVILIEAAAQLVGVIVQAARAENPLSGLKLTAIRQAKILGTGRPGEKIVLHAAVTGELANLIQATAVAEVNGRKVLDAAITLSAEKPVN